MEWWVAYLAVGAVSGLLAGLLGVGGGVVVVPALAFAFAGQGMPHGQVMPFALGTSLAAIACTALASLGAHHTRGAVNWTLAVRLAPGLMAGGFLGASFATRLPSRLLTIIVVVFLWAVATHLLIERPLMAQSRSLPGRPGLVAAGAVIGLVSGMVGIGGGALSVPFLTSCRVKLHEAIGTSAAGGLPIAIAGATGYILNGIGRAGLPHASAGFVYIPALIGVAVASVATAPLGAWLAHRLPTQRLKKMFAGFLYLVGGRLAYAMLTGS